MVDFSLLVLRGLLLDVIWREPKAYITQSVSVAALKLRTRRNKECDKESAYVYIYISLYMYIHYIICRFLEGSSSYKPTIMLSGYRNPTAKPGFRAARILKPVFLAALNFELQCFPAGRFSDHGFLSPSGIRIRFSLRQTPHSRRPSLKYLVFAGLIRSAAPRRFAPNDSLLHIA